MSQLRSRIGRFSLSEAARRLPNFIDPIRIHQIVSYCISSIRQLNVLANRSQAKARQSWKVASQRAFKISGSGIVMMSTENIEKSACFPTSMLPRSRSWNEAKAGQSETLEEGWAADIDDKAAERLLAMSAGYETPGGPAQLRVSRRRLAL